MNIRKFNEIKEAYDSFYKGIMRKGMLPMRSTQKGFWNSSSSEEVLEAFKKIRLEKFSSFIDLGSGDGKIVLIASLFCRNAEGVEFDRQLHEKAMEMQAVLGIKNAIFHNKDFFSHDVSGYGAVFVAPDSPFERGLELKLANELSGSLIHIGHHFHPKSLKKKESFSVNGTLFTVYSK